MRVSVSIVLGVSAANVTPTQKVIELLQGMAQKAEAEKEAEVKDHFKYVTFCEDTATAKQRAIDVGNKKIEQLKAEIATETASSEKLGGEIEELDGEISQAEQEMQAATELRAQEKNDYMVQDQDYAESLDAMDRAIIELKKMDHSTAQAEMLLQKTAAHSKMVSVGEWEQVWRVLAQSKKTGLLQDSGAPEVAAYTSHMGGIIGMLEDMKDKISEEKAQLNTEEANRGHAYELSMIDLSDKVEFDKQIRGEKASARASANKGAAEADGELSETTAVRNEDVQFLSDHNAECKKNSEEFEMRQETRAEEVKALGKAIEILSSDSVAGNSAKYRLVQTGTSFIQRKSSSGLRGPKQQRLFDFLQSAAARLDSRNLGVVAAQLASKSGGDPMAKVKEMISDLIERLEKQASEEAEHHGWCDKQMHDNKLTREELQSTIEQLQAKIDELAASIAKLGDDVAGLETEIKELNDARSKATAQRDEEHKENTATIQDAKEAQAAVQKALEVLKGFYDKAASAEGGYSGQQSESTGVLGMLEVIDSDFARLESETTADEESASTAYNKFMLESGGCGYHKGAEVCGSIADKTDLIKKKTKLSKKQSSEKHKTEKDLQDTQGEMAAAEETHDKLQPACVTPDVSVEERVQKREEEIESLQQALEILEG
mmetsp:Transcript_91103/g.208851  ORF Transcript_91103/g.208851 Transcript_91103/m.208851 type:complete len:660 (+) Transcript_91103:66-2045(+)